MTLSIPLVIVKGNMPTKTNLMETPDYGREHANNEIVRETTRDQKASGPETDDPVRRRVGRKSVGWLMAFLFIAFLSGCGGAASNPIVVTPPAPSLSASTFSPQCSPCTTLVIPVSTLNSGTNIATLGYSAGCTLKAGSTLMNWTATPSGSWFGVTPSFGALQPNTTTPIVITYFNAQAIPVGSTGLVTISAAGYANETGMGLSYQQAGITNGKATNSIAVSCE